MLYNQQGDIKKEYSKFFLKMRSSDSSLEKIFKRIWQGLSFPYCITNIADYIYKEITPHEVDRYKKTCKNKQM